MYYAATDTTHHDWDELALDPVDAITGPGDGHQWMTDSLGEQRVLVTTLVSPFVAGIYRPYINSTYTLGNTRQVWVTLAGEMGAYLKPLRPNGSTPPRPSPIGPRWRWGHQSRRITATL